MIGARDLFTAPLAMTDQVRSYLRTIEVARRVVRDPGRYLLRFPFNLLPARWFLSTRAMEIITRALCTGISFGGTVPAKPVVEPAGRHPLLRVVLARNLQVGDLIDGEVRVREIRHRIDRDRYTVTVTTDRGETLYGCDRALHVKRRPAP